MLEVLANFPSASDVPCTPINALLSSNRQQFFARSVFWAKTARVRQVRNLSPSFERAKEVTEMFTCGTIHARGSNGPRSKAFLPKQTDTFEKTAPAYPVLLLNRGERHPVGSLQSSCTRRITPGVQPEAPSKQSPADAQSRIRLADVMFYLSELQIHEQVSSMIQYG